MILTEQEKYALKIAHDIEYDYQIDAIESAVLAKLKTQEPALVRYNKHMNGEIEPDPVERLRFFLSLALTGQNWLDVEKFLDDLPTDDVVRDAERYKFIKSGNVDVEYDGQSMIITSCENQWIVSPFADFDTAIDAAMEKMK